MKPKHNTNHVRGPAVTVVILIATASVQATLAEGTSLTHRSYLTHDAALSSALWHSLIGTLPSNTSSILAVVLREAPLRPRFSQEQALLELQFTGATTHGLRLALEGSQRRLKLQSTDPDSPSSIVDVAGVPREVILHFSTPASDVPSEQPTEIHVFLDCQPQQQLSLSLPLRDMARQATGLKVFRDKRLRVDTLQNVPLVDVLWRASTSCRRREASSLPDVAAATPSEPPQRDVNSRGYGGEDLNDNRLATRALIDLLELLQESKKAAEVQTRALLMLTEVLSRCQFCRSRGDDDDVINIGVAAVQCSEKPCFRGVSCRDTRSGFQCGPCPPGYAGDGVTCRRTNRCNEQPCFPGVECKNVAGGSGFVCGPCPEGFQVS